MAAGHEPARRLTVNGEPRQRPRPATLLDLLAHLGLDPRTVVVELNREIVRRPRLGDTAVADGDRSSWCTSSAAEETWHRASSEPAGFAQGLGEGSVGPESEASRLTAPARSFASLRMTPRLSFEEHR